jgi:hypothetical protein
MRTAVGPWRGWWSKFVPGGRVPVERSESLPLIRMPRPLYTGVPAGKKDSPRLAFCAPPHQSSPRWTHVPASIFWVARDRPRVSKGP